jgi:Lamin Tail Domain
VKYLALMLVLVAGCGGGDDGGSATLAINEVMPENKTACADPFGEYDDWFEIYNGGSSAVDLEGFYVSDDSTMPMKVQLAAGLSVPAHGVKLFWADAQVQGTDHVNFKLEKNGEDLVLSDPDGVLVDTITFGAATEDSSFARLPDGTGDMALCAHSTCGELNGDTCAP